MSLSRRLAYSVAVWLASLAVMELALWFIWVEPSRTNVTTSLKRQGLYLRDPRLGWRMRPNTTLQFHLEGYGTSIVTTNAAGFRDREHAIQSHTRRVVVVGDSFTFGFGVEVEQRFSAYLERAFPDLEFINLGVPVYALEQERKVMGDIGFEYEPKVVLLAFCLNDILPRDQDFLDARASLPQKSTNRSLKAFLAEHSRLYQLTRAAVNNNKQLAMLFVRMGLKRPPPGFSHLDPNLKVSLRQYNPIIEAAMEKAKADLALMAQLCQDREILFTVAAIPAKQAIVPESLDVSIANLSYDREDFELSKPYRVLGEWCEQLNIRYVNAYPRFAGRDGLYLPGDMHFSPEGHQAFAEAIVPTLRELVYDGEQ
jgi:lysophospholipase L1-like esterase